jgi:capsid protein
MSAAVTDKPKVRVKAGTVAFPDVRPQANFAGPAVHRGGYLRDTRSAVIASRPASLSEHRDEVRRVWRRAAGLALDMILNSGRLRGVADQIIVDSCGTELLLNYQPNLTPFGYSDKEASDWKKLVRGEYRLWCWNAWECDSRGQWNIPQMGDIAIRMWLAYGENCGLTEFMGRNLRREYGVVTGTKHSVFTPSRLVQDTNEAENLFQGVIRDANGRISRYRCEVKNGLVTTKRDFAARDADGRQLFTHAFDPFSAEDERGISPLAATFRKYLMGENTDDATAQMQYLQTVYAMVLTSDKPSAEAFEALEVLKEQGGEILSQDYLNYFSAQLDRAAEGKIDVGDDAGVSHLAPGEDLDFKTAQVPGPNYREFKASIDRETSRALGVSYGAYTLDFTQSTYASTNMENAVLSPLAARRTERLVAPHYLVPFASWLDEAVGEGRIPFKGGYEAFAANREALTWATCIGPSRPTADDEKAARASTERLLNGSSTLDVECGARGLDPQEVFESNQYWHQRYKEAGMPSPFERKAGSQPASEGKDNKEAA